MISAIHIVLLSVVKYYNQEWKEVDILIGFCLKLHLCKYPQAILAPYNKTELEAFPKIGT